MGGFTHRKYGDVVKRWLLPIIIVLQSVLSNRDILWFIDNEAAASSLFRGSSKEQDVHAIAQVSHLLYHHLQCRVWIEWVDSHSNPSDGLSRLCLLDPWTPGPGLGLRRISFSRRPFLFYFLIRFP